MHVIVTLRPTASVENAIAEIAMVPGVLSTRAFKHISGTLVVTVAEGTAFKSVADKLNQIKAVFEVAPDIPQRLTAAVTTEVTLDTFNHGGPAQGGKALAFSDRADPFKRWWEYPKTFDLVEEGDRQGEDWIVVICDSGVDDTHDEFTNLPGRVVHVYGATTGAVHGTYTASIVAGATIGFLPKATILDAKSFSDAGSGSMVAIGNGIDAAIDWILDPGNSVDPDTKVLFSFSFGEATTVWNSGYFGIVTEVMRRGYFMFAASGNDSNDIGTGLPRFWPAAMLKHGFVSAVNHGGQHCFFANRDQNKRLVGLGYQVPSARFGTDDALAWPTGTSMACPYAAGAFATWFGTRKPPRNQREVDYWQKRWIETYCFSQGMSDPRTLSNNNMAEKRFARACNDPIPSGFEVMAYEVAIRYQTVAGTDLLLTNDPGRIGGFRDTTAGRFDPNYATHGTRLDTYREDSENPSVSLYGENEVWVQFTLWEDSNNTINFAGQFLAWRYDTGEAWTEIDVTGFGNKQVARRAAPGGAITNTSIDMQDGLRHVVDVHLVKDNGSGQSVFEVYKNNTQIFTYTGASGGTLVDFLELGGVEWAAGATISNLWVSTASTVGKRNRLVSLEDVGNYDGLVGTYEDMANPGSLGVLEATEGDQKVSGVLTSSSPNVGAISAISVCITAASFTESPDPDGIVPFVRIDDTDYEQTEVAVSPYPEQVISTMTTNPDTTSAWVYADLSGLEFGLKTVAA